MWRKSWVAVACVSVMLGAAAHGCGGGDNTVPNQDMGTGDGATGACDDVSDCPQSACVMTDCVASRCVLTTVADGPAPEICHEGRL